MIPALRAVRDFFGGLYELVRLAFITRFRFRGAYWQWRLHTAFGRGYPPRREHRRSLMHFARWVHQARRNHGA